MAKNFTQGFKRIFIAFTLIFLTNQTVLFGQSCSAPTSPNVINISNFTATLNWDSVVVANHYRIRYQELGASTWINRNNIIPAYKDLVSLAQNTYYRWQVKSYCSSGISNWSTMDTFQTANFPLDCDSVPNGTAFG